VASCGGFFNFSFILDCPPRILGNFTWRPQKEPPISNSKIQILGNFDTDINGSVSHI
jgi:hypothetical protein